MPGKHHPRGRAGGTTFRCVPRPDWSGLTTEQAADHNLAVEHYRETAQQGGQSLATVFTTLAALDAVPSVFHCAASKDRTGIVAALLLRLLGVDREAVAADYALSDFATARWEASVAAGVPDDTQTAWAFVPPAMLVADRDIMIRFLNWLDAEYGSADGLLLQHGLDPAVSGQLRHTLLTTRPAPPNPVRARLTTDGLDRV